MDRSITLTRERWLDEALQVLSESGHGALRAEPLARRLCVSRGSFYWHFQDVASFHRAVLERWEQAAVDRPLKRMARIGQGEGTDLQRLIGVAFTSAPKLERAVRGWAATHAAAADAVAIVDRRRVLGLIEMFEQDGAAPAEAGASAAVLYWTYIGCILSADMPIARSVLREVRARLGSARPHGS